VYAFGLVGFVHILWLNDTKVELIYCKNTHALKCSFADDICSCLLIVYSVLNVTKNWQDLKH